MTTISELNVGDTIRLTGGKWVTDYIDGSPREGIETIVTDVDPDRGWALVETDRAHHVDDNDWPFVLVKRAEPAEPKALAEAIAAGEYHPDLLPMFEKFSKAAADAGYCPEYDRLARNVGAPTRAQVAELVAIRDGREFKVRYTLPVYIDVVVTAKDEEDARNLGFSATHEWEQIFTILEARMAELRERGHLYQLGSWNSDATVTPID